MKINSASNFIEYLNFQKDSRKLAIILLKTIEDCEDFYINFLGRSFGTIGDLLEYRRHKISKLDITFDYIVKLCANGVNQEVIECVFFQPTNIFEVELINDAIANGKTSLEAIYRNFISNPDENILKNVL